ncbi:MAG: hypothetical protein NVS1B10_03170 [Candidatus Saccharimonadales bacterium]
MDIMYFRKLKGALESTEAYTNVRVAKTALRTGTIRSIILSLLLILGTGSVVGMSILLGYLSDLVGYNYYANLVIRKKLILKIREEKLEDPMPQPKSS